MAAFAVCTYRKPCGRLAAILLASALLTTLGPIGCTVWAAKQPHSFRDTTSAEQYERLFWTMARKGNWKKIEPVLAPNIAYAAHGAVLARDQILPYLQSLKLEDFTISNMMVQPNGADMIVTYRIQFQQPGASPKTLVAVSVWQKVRHGLLLIAHSQQPAAPAKGSE